MAGCPFHNGPAGANGVIEGPTDYERYMRTDELLALQKTAEERVHHDELMFQTVHQSFELWCKLVRYELATVCQRLDGDDVLGCLPLLRRAADVIRNQTEALHVLESMNPMDFHVIRAALGEGSGSESPGFRGILADAPRVWPAVEALLERRSTHLEDVYVERQPQDLLLLLEALTDLDMFFHIWRLNHLAMVKRVIGRDVKSLKGYAVHQLEHDVQMVLWPELWAVRNRITDVAGTSPP